MKEKISQKQLIDFGLLIGLGFPLIIGWLLPSIFGHDFRAWTIWIGIPALIMAGIKPSLLLHPYKLWMALGHALGWVNSRIILGLVFLLVLQPIAFVMRLFGYDPLRKEIKIKKKSYRENKEDCIVDLNKIF